jgi:hypothetical protein
VSRVHSQLLLARATTEARRSTGSPGEGERRRDAGGGADPFETAVAGAPRELTGKGDAGVRRPASGVGGFCSSCPGGPLRSSTSGLPSILLRLSDPRSSCYLSVTATVDIGWRR